MAHRRKQKVFRVEFGPGTEFDGLELVTRSLAVKDFAAFGLSLQTIGETLDGGTEADQLKALAGLTDQLADVQERFADKLMSWTMEEEDGTPTPATLEGVKLLDDFEFISLVGAWLDGIGGISADLGKGSGSGETSPELSALMEPLSPSQAS